jgi:hypothetical protein
MKKMGGAIVTAIVLMSIISLINPVGAINTISSSTMIFEGTLTDLGGGIYTGTVYMVDENSLGIGDTISGFDIYARNGATAWFGDLIGITEVWTPVLIGSHDAWPAWPTDTPDWYQYSLNLYMSGGTYRWALRNHPGSTPGSPHSTIARGVPLSGAMDWGTMYARETDVGAYLSGTGTPEIPGGAASHGGGPSCWDMDWSWGSEVVPLQYPGFDVQIMPICGQTYRVILTPAPPKIPPTTRQPIMYSKTLCPLSNYNIAQAEQLSAETQNLLDQVLDLDMDPSEAEKMIIEAHGLLEKAKVFCENSQNCIAANILAIEAQKLLLEAKELLKSILS